MASRDKTVKRGVELYIDGKEIKNDIASVERECRKLTKELRSMERGSAEYVATSKRVRELNGVLAEHRENLRAVREDNKSMLEGLNRWVGKWGTLLATATAGIAALGMAINKYRQEMLNREDTKADVKALTGLADEDIDWLEKKAKELSTTMTESGVRIRQSATEILDAYKLVGSAKPELLSNKQALAEVTEQALVLAQAAGMNLKEAVDAVTLSMNQYGAAASEAERYANVMAAGSKYGAAAVESVTVAIKKAGVAASTAKVPIEQLVGSVEALAEKGIKDAVAGTGLKTFFLKLEKQASDVRPSVVGLQTALENLAAKNLSTSDMIKMFGLEAYTVAQALVSSADKVQYYSDVVTGTATATEQAGIKSQTAAARLEQLKNEFTENGMILAEQLAPVISKFMGWTNKFVQALPIVIRFIKDYGGELTIISGTILLLTARIKLAAMATSAWNAATSLFTKSATALKGVLTSWNLIIAAIGAATLMIYKHIKGVKDAEQAWRDEQAKMRKVESEYDKMKTKINELHKAVTDQNVSLAERKKALDELQKIVPEYNGSLTREGKLINDNKTAIDNYLVSFKKKLMYQSQEEKLRELYQQKFGLEDEIADLNTKYWDKRQENALAGIDRNSLPQKINRWWSGLLGDEGSEFGLEAKIKTREKELQGILSSIEKIESRVGQFQDELEDAGVVVSPDGDTDPSPTSATPEKESAKKKRIRMALLAVDTEYDKKAAELKAQYIRGDLKSETEYTSRLQSIELARLSAKLQVAEIEESQRADFMDKIMSMEINMRKKLDELLKVEGELSAEERLSLLDKEYQERIEMISQAYMQGIIPTEERMNEYLLAVEENFARKRKEILDKEAEEEEKARKQREKDAEESAKKEHEVLEAQLEKYKELAEEITDVFGELGENIAEALWGDDAKNKWKEAGKAFLLDALSLVEKYLLIKQTQIIADAIASATTLVGAGPAIAKAAGKMLAIKTAFGLAKGAINSFSVGGYTGAGRWDEPRGVVHAGEFVANRFATHNPAVNPVLGLIDAAQKSGSIRNLSGEDIAAVALSSNRQTSSPMVSSSISQQSVPVDALIAMMGRLENTMKLATEAYRKPSKAVCYVKGKGGIEEAMNLSSLMDKNASR